MTAISSREVNLRLTVGLLTVLLCLAGSVIAGVGWRTDGRGFYPDAEPPTAFSPTENVVWAAPMPSWSNACPVVLGDRVFTSAEPDLLIAVDKTSGKVLWERACPIGEALISEEQARETPAKTHAHNGFTSSTPVTDGKRVFAVMGSGVVAAYDLDGERLWMKFVEKPLHPWGHCASPLLVGDRLIVQYETMLALDPATGEEVWRQPAEKWPSQRKKKWGTATPTRIGDVDVVVTVTGNVIRVDNGEVLFFDLAAVTYSSPLIVDGVAYFIGAKKGRAVRLPDSLEGEPELLWETVTVKDRYYGSPALKDGVLYAIARAGQFSAFDAKTGEEIYQQKLLLAATEKEINATYTSITVAGEFLFFTGMDGSVVVVTPGREFREVARLKVETALRSTPVFEGKRVYLRAPGHLYCFGE
jgi:outer membrane protein assembly factor BamB